MTITEVAPAKVNLVLRVGAPRVDGLHPLCSIFASVELADRVTVHEAAGDVVACPGVQGENLVSRAVQAYRRAVPHLPPLAVAVEKRIPIAAGLGGGSADAAAVLRAANELSGRPLSPAELRRIAAGIGSDVPSQVEPRHALVQGTGEAVEPVELPPLGALLVPAPEGLSTAAVYAELDRLAGWRERLDAEALRRLAHGPPERLAAALENDLQAAAISLRPGLADTLASLRAAGALGVAVSGSGPTCFGLFADRDGAEGVRGELPGSLPVGLRS